MVREHFGDECVLTLVKEQYFVDFMRDAEEPTGEELSEEDNFDMPHIYETIPSWDGLKERLYYFMNQYNEQVWACTSTSFDL